MPEIDREMLNKLMETLLREHSVDFRDYKPSSLGRRVQRRIDATKCPDLDSYLSHLEQHPEEYAQLLDSILINVTEFFRDPEAWEEIKNNVIPEILAGKHPGDQIRFWSAGCATGQEAYSLALLLVEALGDGIGDYDVRIYATDIDEDALSVARRAEYSEDAVAAVPQETIDKYFVNSNKSGVSREIRKMVIFGRHNLVTDAPISHVDLIVCRNVLIYMTVELQNRLLAKFHYGLNPGGYLFLGKAESLLNASRLFNPVNDRWRIFRKESPATGRGMTEQQSIGQAVEQSGVEYQVMASFNEGVLRYTPAAVIALDEGNVVRSMNPPAEAVWGVRPFELMGKHIFQVDTPAALQSILPMIPQVRSHRAEFRLEELDLSAEHGRPYFISATISPMFDAMGGTVGIVLIAENITSQVRLRNELEATNEQLATNEELETTNEELQSTNEELETTNEELQSTNEELETTNEELQSTNEELSATNDEIVARTDDLNIISLYYESVVGSIDFPIVVLDQNNIITTWNPAAALFYGLKTRDAVNRSFLEIGLPLKVSRTRDRLRKVAETRKSYSSRPITYKTRAGVERRVIVEYQPLVDAQDVYKGAISIVRDADLRPIEPASH